MTSRSLFLLCAFLLLMGSLANAATLPQPVPATPDGGAPAFMTPAATSPGCAKAELPFLAPKPSQKAGLPCGSCSDQWCAGSVTGNYCTYLTRLGYKSGTCQIPYGNECSADPSTWQCACWNGPLP